jgi:hypothetical protein
MATRAERTQSARDTCSAAVAGMRRQRARTTAFIGPLRQAVAEGFRLARVNAPVLAAAVYRGLRVVLQLLLAALRVGSSAAFRAARTAIYWSQDVGLPRLRASKTIGYTRQPEVILFGTSAIVSVAVGWFIATG